MSYEYDENNGLQPKPPKKNDNDLGSWIFIAVMFAVAWPVGLILLLSKLSEGGGRKMRQQARDAWQRTAAGGAEAQATAAPEATPTATADIMSGIQTGDSAVNKILAGTWTFERTDADKKTDEGSASQILPSTDTGAKETTDVKEPGTIRELTFRTNGTGTYTDANGTPLAFEFALNGDNLTLALENGTVQMFRCTLENGLMYLTPMSNNGAYQAFTDVFRQTQSTSGETAN